MSNKHFFLPVIILGLTTLSFIFLACDKDEGPVNENCPEKAIESKSRYNRSSDMPFVIDSAYIEDQCLFIFIEHSGGCESLSYELVDRGDIAESYPVQRWIKLLIRGTDNCDALVYPELSFDLTPIQAMGEEVSTLHLEGWDEPLEHYYAN